MLAKTVRWLSRPEIFVFACLWLIVLLVFGTLAQRTIGLYRAQELYFSSWLLMAGPMPLPGGRLTLLVVFVSLLTHLCLPKTWAWRRAGLLIAHLGALLLLVGGFTTAYFSSEGSMVIPEGESSNYVSDYRNKELAIIDPDDPRPGDAWTVPPEALETGRSFSPPGFPGSIEIIASFPNCRGLERPGEESGEWRGIARRYRLEAISRAAEPDEELAGAVFRITGAGSETNGKYIVVENAREPLLLRTGEKTFELTLRRSRTYLPFRLELVDFEKKVHPGTGMASSYKSVVNLIEGDMRRRVVIQMNEPLRHGGYTFYQSSFIEGGPKETTILAAVKNRGRLFPYISSLIMCLGLMVHLFLMLFRRSAGDKGGSER